MRRAVLFDLDDTLMDTETATNTAVTSWAAEHGIQGSGVGPRWAAISEIQYARYQRRELTHVEQRRERVRQFLEVDFDDAHTDDVFTGYLKRYEEAWTVFDDAVPALRRARGAGLVVVVLTNGDEAHQRLKLAKLGLSEEIDIFVASSMLPAGKPDARAFRHAAELAGVAPGHAFMVGDSLEKDVHGALAAGLGAVLLDRRELHAEASVRRVTSLDELIFTR